MTGPTFLDLFCGAGGLSSGLVAAGWQPQLATDAWSEALETYRLNHATTPTHHGDVKELTGRALARALRATPQWVVGGPPCQGFSTVGKRSRRDARNRLVHEFRRVVRELRPAGFLIENVLGMKDMRFVGVVEELFGELGYAVATHVLTSADFGVPQLRRRLVFVGDARGRRFLGPRPTHDAARHVTVLDAIGDLPPLAPGESATAYKELPTTDYQREMRCGSRELQGHCASRHPAALVRAIRYVPDGGSRRSIPPKHQPRSGYHNSYSRLSSREPAVAVTQNMGKPSGTRCIHPFQHRGLTAREGARLQSFPDRHHFVGGMVSQRLQVANAVPPLLARAIGAAITSAARWE